MTRRKNQAGHGLIEHVIQFALLAGIIVAIITCARSGDEERLPAQNNRPVAAGQQLQQPQQQQSYYTSRPIGSRMATSSGVQGVQGVQGGYQPAGDPRLIRRSDPRLRQRELPQETNFEEPVEIDQKDGDTVTDEGTMDVERTAPASAVSKVSQRTDLRVVRMKQEDPEKMGRIIIIVAVVALAVIVFWFIHSNMMYKRTLRAVAATQPKPEETPAAGAPEPAAETAHDAGHGHGHGHEEEVPKEKSAIVERLEKLKAMFEQGLISQEDYDNKKKEILAKL